MKLLKLLPLLLFFFVSCKKKKVEYIYNEGLIFGTVYHIAYKNDIDLHDEIKQEMLNFDSSLSTYNPKSVISRLNRNDSTLVLDKYFLTLFKRSQQISDSTKGAFDITVAPLVNAWGFGFKEGGNPEGINIDSLLSITGYKKIILKNNKIIKADKRIMLDASAIAKGYGVDVVANFIKSRGISDYMVEIGGEIRVSGKSSKDRLWRVGIDEPIDDPGIAKRKIQNIIRLSNCALATSGNYRQFYVKNGRKYAHTISPTTGYPVQHKLLSATVVAPDCMTADAYATAFMVLGLDKSLEIISRNKNIEVFFILSDDKGKYNTYCSPSLKEKLIK